MEKNVIGGRCMKKIKTAILGVGLLGLLASHNADAKELRDAYLITPTLGYHFFDGERKLENGFELGLAVERFLNKNVAVEAYLGYIGTKHEYRRNRYEDKNIFSYNFNLNYNFVKFADNVIPYLTAGIGSNDSIIPGIDYGAGVRIFFSKRLGIKAEIKHFYLGAGDNDIVTSVGLTYVLGGKPKHVSHEMPSKIDSDGDGISDDFDQCPNTPAGVTVDDFGCPVDSDLDGVPDYKDKCPFTPEGINVNEEGCPKDSDGDGVPDYLDKCPDTPKGAAVYSDGCPVDFDNDGVPDYKDKCPDTPAGAKVNEEGCPADSDNDGVPDTMDKCPNTPEGVAVDENGCMQSMTLRIYFDPNSTKVKPEYYVEIEKLAKYLKEHPDVKVEIQGHTDKTPRSNYEYNMRLSQKRAEAVKRILVEKFGISPDRIIAKGYGYTKPIAPNDTPEGRAKNRRIEAVIIK